jgi:hypothetical protein
MEYFATKSLFSYLQNLKSKNKKLQINEIKHIFYQIV